MTPDSELLACYARTGSEDAFAELDRLTGDPAQPGIQTAQLTNQLSLHAGQTVVLQHELPPGGWLPDETNVPAGPRSLVVFITPQVVDSRGRPRYP